MGRVGSVGRVRIGADDPFTAVVSAYAHNLLVGTVLRELQSALVSRLDDNTLVLAMAHSVGNGTRSRKKPVDIGPGVQLRRALQRYIRAHPGPHNVPAAAAPVSQNLELIQRLLGLDDEERDVLQFLLALQDSSELRELVECFGDLSLRGAATVLSAAIGIRLDRALAVIGPTGRLAASGLVAIDLDDTETFSSKLKPKAGLLDAVVAAGLDRDQLVARFVPEAGESTLAWADFDHLQAALGVTRALLNGALSRKQRGVNVLLYGKTGTGKTETARLLARELGTKLYTTCMDGSFGEPANGRERLSSLLLGQRLLQGGHALILFDELEDVFQDRAVPLFGGNRWDNSRVSKAWLNDLLETNPIPTIWITNAADCIDPAFLRRFAYAIEFQAVGPKQRARILARHLGSEAADLAPTEVDAIAERFEASPAQIGSAVMAARLIEPAGRPTREGIEGVLGTVQRLVTGASPRGRASFDAASYRIDALSSPDDLAGIAERLSAWAPDLGQPISMCLYGPPGTGKSEYVAYLAHRMGRPILQRRASDILSCWVGGTEDNVAKAFHQAEDEGAVLLFDEVDSFLRDRRTAVRSWEVTAVNEFLQQLESFRGFVACTTNLWKDLDEASLRRFVLKVELRFLGVDQAMVLIRAMVDRGLVTPIGQGDEKTVRRALLGLEKLAAGDFAVVARRLRAFSLRPSAAELVQLLATEVRAKAGPSRVIGFQESVGALR